MLDIKTSHEPKYPVGNAKTAQEVQQQMGRITSKLAARINSLNYKGDLSTEYGNGRVGVRLESTSERGQPKVISAALSSGNRGSSHLHREVGEGSEATKLDVSSVAADTMHGWIFRGSVADSENGTQQLTGTEAVHHAAKNFAELRSTVASQEVANKEQITQNEATKQQARNASLSKLY